MLFVECSERASQDLSFEKLLCKMLIANLQIDNSVTVYANVQLLDFLSKNANEAFHRRMGQKGNESAYLLALRRVRKKMNLKNHLEKKEVKLRWAKSDALLLSLV